MKPSSFFHHCPRCGVRPDFPPENVLVCRACGFTYYFNAALAVAAVLLDPEDRILLIERAREPARGKLALPGGFVEIGETAEAALSREIREEVGLEVREFEFLCSRPNEYLYSGITYPIVDLFFTARLVSIHRAVALDEVASIEWRGLREIDLERIAFRSVREALLILQSRESTVG